MNEIYPVFSGSNPRKNPVKNFGKTNSVPKPYKVYKKQPNQGHYFFSFLYIMCLRKTKL